MIARPFVAPLGQPLQPFRTPPKSGNEWQRNGLPDFIPLPFIPLPESGRFLCHLCVLLWLMAEQAAVLVVVH
jgi:hypothetical protein